MADLILQDNKWISEFIRYQCQGTDIKPLNSAVQRLANRAKEQIIWLTKLWLTEPCAIGTCLRLVSFLIDWNYMNETGDCQADNKNTNKAGQHRFPHGKKEIVSKKN